MPSVPFLYGRMIPTIPQTGKDLSFAREKIREGFVKTVFEELSAVYAHDLMKEGKMLS